MARYVIGDIHGCFNELVALLRKLDFNPGKDDLILVGDVINRGPKSLQTIRLLRRLDHCVRVTLGNHDLSLLRAYYLNAKLKKHDTTQDLIAAPDAPSLLGWLRAQSMLIAEEGVVVVHAGLYPSWGPAEAWAAAQDVERVLRGPNFRRFLEKMYGSEPCAYSSDLEGMDRLRCCVNAMTRMRCVKVSDSSMDFSYNRGLGDIPEGLTPWFRARDRKNKDLRIVFGHWSALGFYEGENVTCVDSGCLWGGSLTALDFDALLSGHGARIAQVKSESGIPLL